MLILNNMKLNTKVFIIYIRNIYLIEAVFNVGILSGFNKEHNAKSLSQILLPYRHFQLTFFHYLFIYVFFPNLKVKVYL